MKGGEEESNIEAASYLIHETKQNEPHSLGQETCSSEETKHHGDIYEMIQT